MHCIPHDKKQINNEEMFMKGINNCCGWEVTNLPGVCFAQVGMEDRLVLHHLHNTFSV